MAPPTPTPPSNPKPAPGPTAELNQVLDAAELMVERAVIAAERSLAQRLGLRGLRLVLVLGRAVWLLAIIVYFAFALAVLVTRYYLLPHIDDWRPRIEEAASAALHIPVTISSIEADWQGLHPRLLLRDVALQDASGHNTLALGRVDAVLSWTSLLAWQPRMYSLSIVSPQIQVKRLRNHRFDIAGFLIDPQAAQSDTALLDWLLAQRRISILDAQVRFVDESAGIAEKSAAPEPDGHPVQAQAAARAVDAATPAEVEQERQYDFKNVNFLLTQELTGHRFSLQLRPPAKLAGSLDLRGQFRHLWGEPISRIASWSGRLFLQFDYADLAQLDSIVHLIPVPAHLERAQGALRAWLDFSDLQVTRLRADVALTDVNAQWRPDLDPMRLDSVRGRITQSLTSDRQSETQELVLTGLSMDGPDGLHLPSTDLLLRTKRARVPQAAPGSEQSQFQASHLLLSDWSRLARQFPLPPSWLNLIEHTAAQGTLDDVHASWDGPQTPPRNYALRARFSGLGFALEAAAQATAAASAPAAADRADAPAALPATDTFENLAGSIDLTQDAGSLRLDGSAVRARFPAIFGDTPLALDALSTQVRWTRDARSRLSVDVDSLALSNEDIELRGAGSYRNAGGTGADPARLDLSGRIVRAKVNAVARYLPTFLPGPTRSWLKGALLDGTVSDGSFVLRGDPAHFPFVEPHSGEFHVGVQVHEGRLDVAPAPAPGAASPAANGTAAAIPAPAVDVGASQRTLRWPELAGIEASVAFDRDRMTILARRARAFGYELSNISAQIPHMGTPNQRLSVDGEGSGLLAEMLRYAAASPVNPWTGDWLGGIQASGPARLNLKLDVPLAHPSESTVQGRLVFQNDALSLLPGVAPFSAVNGELDFTQRGIRLNGISAGFAGGEVRLGGETKADGAVLIQGNGTATPQGIRSMVQPPTLQRLVDHTRGQFRYSAQVSLRNDTFGLQIDTDLLGLASNLPQPFRKTAAEARQLRIEIVPVAGSKPARDTLRASLAGGLDAELQRIAADGGMRIERGVIGVGAHPNLPDSGVLLFVDEPSLDIDRWHGLLTAAAPGGASAALPPSSSSEAADKAPTPAPDWSAATDTAASAPFDQVVLRAKTLTLAGKTINDVSLSARRDSYPSWQIDIDSEQAVGSVRWADSNPASHGRLTARLAKLSIPERDQKQVSDLLTKSPTEFPELDIVADQFELGTHHFGRLELAAQGSGDPPNRVWNLAKLVIANPDGKVMGSGTWQREGTGSGRRMNLKVAVNCTNAGGMLDRFGLAGYVKNGSGRLEGDLSWVGTPFSVDFPSLSGNLHLAAEKGQVLKLDAGAGRLLAVFSFQSFWNLVTGDLREFSAGVAFDSVNANATIAKGVLSTDDFLMKGASGAGRIKGALDLLSQTQDLEVVVVPEVSASAATLAYAAFVNPAIGLSTFVGTYLLNKPLSAAFTRVFSVTGAWSNPQIKSIKRESRGAVAAPSPTPSPASASSATAPGTPIP